jgi:hypothetical protein
MKAIYQTSFIAVILLTMTSCGGWSEKDEEQFHEACDKMKIVREQCDCMLEKSKANFSNFDEIKNDQKAMAEIITSEDCLAAGDVKKKKQD